MSLRARLDRLERALPPTLPNDRPCEMCGGIGDGAAIVLARAEELAAWYALEGCPRCGRGRVVIPDHGRDPDVAARVMARRTLAPPGPPPGAPDLAALTAVSHPGVSTAAVSTAVPRAPAPPSRAAPDSPMAVPPRRIKVAALPLTLNAQEIRRRLRQ